MNPPQDETDTVSTPHGGTAPRCTGNTKSGRRCAKPGRRGYATCASHQADDEATVETGERKGPGRPAIHALYSRTTVTSIQQLREEVAALEIDLEGTDEELKTIRAVVWFLLGQAEGLNAKATMLEAAVDAVERTLEDAVVIKDGQPGHGELTIPQARQLGAQLAQGYKLLSAIGSFADRLLESNFKVIAAAKIRADTKARLAEQQAVRHFGELAQRLTQVVWEIAPDADFIDLYEARILKDVLKPAGLELNPEETKLASAN